METISIKEIPPFKLEWVTKVGRYRSRMEQVNTKVVSIKYLKKYYTTFENFTINSQNVIYNETGESIFNGVGKAELRVFL